MRRGRGVMSLSFSISSRPVGVIVSERRMSKGV